MNRRQKAGVIFNRRAVEWIGILLAVGGVIITISGHIRQYGGFFPGQLFEDMYTNLGAELTSIAITVLIIDKLAQRREAVNEVERLIREMGSKDSGTALRAVEELRARNALSDGSLVRADFKYANLEGADLSGADLRGAYMSFAVLRDCDLRDADLRGATLREADLENGLLLNVRLDESHCHKANLSNARMHGASMRGADMRRVSFSGARGLSDETFSAAGQLRKATMPSGARYDGRYALVEDLAGMDDASVGEIAEHYGIELGTYLKGVQWRGNADSENEDHQ